jgi:[acyl-carrier-protein] S-malonyltransferase
MKVAFVFPGQGSQIVGMGKELHDSFPAARAVFEKAEQAFGGGLTRLCFEGPEEDLKRTQNTQPAILTTSIACLRVLQAQGIQPAVVAGHSVGEYAALVAAGSLDEADAVKLTKLRGNLMETACPAGTGGMAAIMGAERADVEALCAQVKETGVAQVAALNTTGQIVIAGHIRALTEVIALANAKGVASATMLPVSGPFHSALMQPAADGLKKALDSIAFKPAAVPVIANVDAKPHQEPSELKALLVQQLTLPVLWQTTVEAIIKSGVDCFVELGAGRVISGLIRRLDRRATCHSVRDPESLAKTVDAFKAAGHSAG